LDPYIRKTSNSLYFNLLSRAIKLHLRRIWSLIIRRNRRFLLPLVNKKFNVLKLHGLASNCSFGNLPTHLAIAALASGLLLVFGIIPGLYYGFYYIIRVIPNVAFA
jgi:hypothetical protein